MILGILLSCLLHVTISGVLGQKWDTKLGAPLSPEPEVCLTGHMTDVQKWVDENGVLTKWTDPLTSVDLSSTKDAVTLLTKEVQGAFKSSRVLLQYLSLANCGLGRVPTVFQLRDRMGRTLSDTLQYVSLYGNNFADVSAPGEQYDMTMNATWATELPVDYRLKHRGGDPIWTVGFQRVTLSKLRELDLRKCSIQMLSDNLFSGMPELQALYLGENNINLVSTYAFDGLFNLQHLDISSNIAKEERNLVFDSTDVLRNLTRLTSLDFSFTKILQRNVGVLVNLGPRLQRLSLCHTGLRLPANAFRTTSMRYLDLSGNSGILGVKNVLSGIEKSLQVLYANNVVLRNLDLFYRFKALEILKLKSNELSYIASTRITYSLQNLQILDLDKNRIATWFGNVFGGMGKLKYLSLRDNNINLISEDVIADIRNISYLALSGNNPVCNCHARDLFETALKNDNATQIILQSTAQPSKNPYDFHNGFSKINQIIANRTPIKKACGKMCPEIEFETDGKFVLIDYDPDTYLCLMLAEGKILSFNSVPSCVESRRESDYYEDMWGRWRGLLSLLVIPIVLFPLMIFAYRYRRNFKYFVITLKNSATLSLINNKEGVYDETAIYNYDVFVSYCDEDRDWVLDYLLPHLEKDCNVSVCLHQRDFQVGLSILENIVSCMDRSRSIMLILSKRFLLSQWCQFEMHLAQHRLLETRREDLTLVLLEDIPRRLRPTILHYLMLTKTYIVWPKVVSEQAIFWKRLKKSITTYRLNENVSLA